MFAIPPSEGLRIPRLEEDAPDSRHATSARPRGHAPEWVSETIGVPFIGRRTRNRSGSARGLQVGEDSKVFPQVPRDQEVTADPLPPRPPHRLPLRGIPKQLDRPIGALLYAGDGGAMSAILDLEPDSGDVATDHRDALSQGTAHDEAKTLAERFRDRHVGLPLEDVHLERADPPKIGEEVDVRIIARMPRRSLEPHPPFRVVPGHRGHHQDLHPRYLLLHQAIRIDDSDR